MASSTKDHWSSETTLDVFIHSSDDLIRIILSEVEVQPELRAYTGAASFVPQLTTKVLQYLDPQPTDDILDIGCGDGVLNAKIAPSCSHIIGLDSSASMIQTANTNVGSIHKNTEFHTIDCRHLSPSEQASNTEDGQPVLKLGFYEKVFSNAAMHWILRDESIRSSFFSDVNNLLKPGGLFVFEMGGFENIAELHTALYAVLSLKYNIPIEKIEAVDPWFFPSIEWMSSALKTAGFSIEKIESESRPTKATPKSADGSGGTEGWIRLMGANFLELLNSEDEKHSAVAAVLSVTRRAMTKIEDGSQWLGYVRLRAVAKKAM